MSISFFVPGVPVTQGSMRAYKSRHMKHAVIVHDKSKELKSWRGQIAYFADTAMKLAGMQEPLKKHEPVWLSLDYFLPRPRSHYGTGRNVDKLKPSAPKHHVTKPDIDKLERAVKDALTGVVYTDDSQVVHTTHGKDYGDKPGVRITIETRNGNEPF